MLCNDPYGNRTHVTAVKGRCLNRLTNGSHYIIKGSGRIRTYDTYGFLQLILSKLCANSSTDPYATFVCMSYAANDYKQIAVSITQDTSERISQAVMTVTERRICLFVVLVQYAGKTNCTTGILVKTIYFRSSLSFLRCLCGYTLLGLYFKPCRPLSYGSTAGHTFSRRTLSNLLYHKELLRTLALTGLVGFEPTNAGIKILCLPAWRQPKIATTVLNYRKNRIHYA